MAFSSVWPSPWKQDGSQIRARTDKAQRLGNRIRRYSADCTGALGSPCLIHTGPPVQQIRIKVTCVQHGVRVCEKRSDRPRESDTFTNECHCYSLYTLVAGEMLVVSSGEKCRRSRLSSVTYVTFVLEFPHGLGKVASWAIMWATGWQLRGNCSLHS